MILIFILIASIIYLNIITDSFPRLEIFLVKEWIVGFLSIDDNNINACNSNGSGIVQSIINKLFLDCDFKLSIFLLKLLDNIFHILFNLVLLFYLKSVLSIRCQLGIVLIILFANQKLHMIELGWKQVALHERKFVSHLAIISSYFYQSI